MTPDIMLTAIAVTDQRFPQGVDRGALADTTDRVADLSSGLTSQIMREPHFYMGVVGEWHWTAIIVSAPDRGRGVES